MISLRLRLTLFGGGVVALAILVFGLLLYALLSRSVVTNQDDALKTRANQAEASLGTAPLPQPPVAPADLSKSTDVFIEVLATDGSALYSTAVLNGQPPAATPALLDRAQHQHGAFATVGSIRIYALPYPNGYIVTGQSTRVPQSNLSGVVVFLVISAVPSLIAALLASWLVAGRALRPLKIVAAEAEEIGRTRNFARRLPMPRSRDEVATLAASFNGMLGRLQNAFELQRQFVADASHELRTPLTTVQANANLLASRPVTEDTRRAAIADIVVEGGRMTRLVDRLLTLARADSGLQLARSPVELKTVVDEACRQAAASHVERRLIVESDDATVDGDEDGLRQLLWILLDNAFQYAKTTVGVHLHTEAGWARLTVSDDGPGIPPESRERIFERFYRVDSSRSGSHAGLGLAIARWIVAQHHGQIMAGDAEIGGAAFLVDLPVLSSS